MNKWPFADLSLKSRILLLTIVPMLIITMSLTAFLIISRQKDAREELLLHADATVRYLSRISEIAVLTGDLNSLDGFAKASLGNRNVKGVAFFDQNGVLLISSGTGLTTKNIKPSQASIRENKGIYWRYQSPVFESELQVDDIVGLENEQDKSTPAILGWVELLIDEESLRERQHEILITGLLIGGAGFILLIFLSLRFAISITRPLSELSRTVGQLEKGCLDTRLNIEAKGELGVLVRGINQLANRVQLSSEELQGSVDDATQRLSLTLQTLKQRNNALQETSEKLISANAAKDAFLARMSHELRTPINSVLGYSSLLSKTDLHDDQQEYVQIINEASSLLLETSDDILDFSKLQSDNVQLELAPYNLESLLDAIIAMHAYASRTKSLELILFIEPDVPVNLIGDAFRLRQVINNLIGNAVKFTDTGYVALEISLVEEDASHVTLEFRVKDTGIGIEKDVQERVFEAFQQADMSTTRQYGGTGLGLVIVKKLVVLMGGNIWINNDNDTGSEFVFTIKCIKQEQAKRTESRNSLLTEHNPLVYDRNNLSSKAICSYLAELGVTVVASSERQTLEKVMTSIPKNCSILILSLDNNDLQNDAFRAFVSSQDEHFCGIILVISRLTREEWHKLSNQQRLRDNVHYLGKPLTRTGFQSKICALLNPADVVKTISDETKQATLLLAGLTIIVAEDNHHIRRLLETILKQYGADVLTAENGLQVLELSRKHTADLLVVDLHMPQMDGIEVCQKLKTENSKLPIILLTADLVTNQQKLMDELGVNLVLYKPFDNIKLINAIATLLKKPVPSSTDQAIQKSLLDHLPASVVIDEIRRLVRLIKSAARQGDFDQVKSLAHQLRGITVARRVGQEIQAIARRIDDCFADDQPDIQAVQVLVGQLSLINLR